MARSIAHQIVRENGKNDTGVRIAASSVSAASKGIGVVGYVTATPMMSTSTSAVCVTQMLMNHEPSQWPGRRRKCKPHRGHTSTIRTH